MKLQYKSTLLMFVFGSVFLIAISVSYYFHSRDDTLKSAHRSLRIIAEDISLDVEILLKEKAKVALTLSNSPIIKQALTRSNFEFASLTSPQRQQKIKKLDEKWIETDQVTDPFIQERMNNPIANHLRKQEEMILGEYGEIFLTNRYGVMVATTKKLTTLAHAHKYWWTGSYDNGAGKIFFDDRGFDMSVQGYVLGVVVPVMHDNQIIGILKCNLNILGTGFMHLVLKDLEQDNSFHFSLVRSSGMVVVGEDKKPLSTKTPSLLVEMMKKHKTESKVIQENSVDKLIACAPIHITHDAVEYVFGGTYKSSDHINGSDGDGWCIIVSQDLKDVLAVSTNTTKWMVIIGIIYTLLMAVVALLLGKIVSRPVVKLARHAKNIGQGDLKSKITVTSKDELGILADSFNKMAHDLQRTMISRDSLIEEIKQRKQAEEAVHKSEEKYRLLVENQTDMIVRFDAGGRLLFVSPSYCKVFAKTEKELLGKKFISLIHEDDREKVAKEIKNVFSSPYSVYIEERSMTKDGFRWQGWLNTAELNEKNEVVAVNAVGRDITERKKAEKELENIFNLSPDMICVANPDGKLAKINPAWEKVLGYTADEILKLGWTGLVHPDDVGATNKEVERQLKGSSVINFTNRFKCKDGTYKTLEWQATPSEIGIVHATARDITERKRAEKDLVRYRDHLEELVQERTAELEAAQQELVRKERLAVLGQLTATVSHEIRNPLGTIRTAVFSISKAIERNQMERIGNALIIAERNIIRCDGIIEELLDFTRVRELKTRPTDIDKWLKRTLSEQVIPKGIEFTHKLHSAVKVK